MKTSNVISPFQKKRNLSSAKKIFSFSRSLLASILLIFSISFAETPDAIRDTVYVHVKPKADTLYYTPTEPDSVIPMNQDTCFTLRSFYLHVDLISAVTLYATSTPILNLTLEKSFNKKNSLLFLASYVKVTPYENGSGNEFNEYYYSGDIQQTSIGLSYRRYAKETILSGFWEFGCQILMRKVNFINIPDRHWKIDYPDKNKEEQGTQLYIHKGWQNRSRFGGRIGFGFELGVAYNFIPNSSPLDEVMYMTKGWQLDLEFNLGIGL